MFYGLHPGNCWCLHQHIAELRLYDRRVGGRKSENRTIYNMDKSYCRHCRAHPVWSREPLGIDAIPIRAENKPLAYPETLLKMTVQRPRSSVD